MKRIILTFIFIGIVSQALAKKEGKIQEDKFGTETVLSYLGKDGTFLDEMKMKLSLTPEQMEKMKIIIKAEQDAIETLRQKWMDIVKKGTLSVEQRREERNNMDKKVIEIAQKTKIDVMETLTTFQYKEFISLIRQKWTQEWMPTPKPQKELSVEKNPFKDALQENKGTSTPPLTEAQEEAEDEFTKAIREQSKDAEDLFSDSQQEDFSSEDEKNNPFAFPDSESLDNPFEEALQEESEKKE